MDRKTVRRYITLATAEGLAPGPEGAAALTAARLEAVLVPLKRGTGRPHGVGWEWCVAHRDFIERTLEQAKLSKVRRLLLRQGVDIQGCHRSLAYTIAPSGGGAPEDALRTMLQHLIHETLEREFQQFLGAGRFERSPARRGVRRSSHCPEAIYTLFCT